MGMSQGNSSSSPENFANNDRVKKSGQTDSFSGQPSPYYSNQYLFGFDGQASGQNPSKDPSSFDKKTQNCSSPPF